MLIENFFISKNVVLQFLNFQILGMQTSNCQLLAKTLIFFLALSFHHALSNFFLSWSTTAPEPSLRGAIAKTAIKIVRNLQNNWDVSQQLK
jgi:hypothetical protein